MEARVTFALVGAGFLDEHGVRWTPWIPLLTGRFGGFESLAAHARGPAPVGRSSRVVHCTASSRPRVSSRWPACPATRAPPPRPLASPATARLPRDRSAEPATARPSPRPLGSQRIDQIRVGSLRSPPGKGAPRAPTSELALTSVASGAAGPSTAGSVPRPASRGSGPNTISSPSRSQTSGSPTSSAGGSPSRRPRPSPAADPWHGPARTVGPRHSRQSDRRLEERCDVAVAAEHTNDLQRPGLRPVDHQVRVHRPHPQGLVGQIVARGPAPGAPPAAAWHPADRRGHGDRRSIVGGDVGVDPTQLGCGRY